MVALCALVYLLVSMSEHVRLQMSTIVAWQVEYRAHALQCSVSDHVDFHSPIMFARIVAYCVLVWLLDTVSLKMTLEIFLMVT